MLEEQGFPDFFTAGDGGKVLLCLEDCKVAVATEEDAELWPKFLFPILVHEHAHAIAREGVKQGGGYFHDWTGRLHEEKAVSESLAEWAELDYCREDAALRDIILGHAASGDFPVWPYAGALLLEKLCSDEGVQAYRELLREYRSGNPWAYGRLDDV